MKKVTPYVLTLALLSSGAVYGAAQSAPSTQPLVKVFFQEHEHERWEEGARQAQETGYQTGLHDGRWDVDHNRPFRFQEESTYKRADQGYEERFGDRARYQEVFRKAYEHGYREGYHRR
jgi:hypothetical protein